MDPKNSDFGGQDGREVHQEGSWTIKSRRLTPDLRNAVRIASKRAGLGVGDWTADRLWQAVRAELRHGEATVPATMDDVQSQLDQLARAVSALTEVVSERIGTKHETEQAPANVYEWATGWIGFFVPGFGRT